MIGLPPLSTDLVAAKRKFFQGNTKYAYSNCKSKKYRTSASCTIYGSAFSPNLSGKTYLVACTSNGLICVWDSKGATTEPIIRVEASVAGKVLYDVQFIESSGVFLLVVSGDPGILVYKWSVFLNAMDDHIDDGNVVQLEPITRFKPHQSPSDAFEPVEINCTSYSAVDDYLYGGAGDAFGCYQWDMRSEKLVGTFGGAGNRCNGHNDYLHDVLSIPNNNNLVLTAGEDGAIAFWDGKQRKLIEMMNVQNTLNKNKHSVTWQIQNKGFGSTQQWNGSNLWVSSMERKGDWLAAVGGSESGNNMSLRSGPSTAGFMATWHLPTRTFNSGCVTRESYNAIAYNQHLDSFVSGGNDGRVTFWDSATGACTGRSGCTPSMIYALSCNAASSTMVVGGTGGSLDCFIERVNALNFTA